MKQTELLIRGTNCPICPACGNGNAMFDRTNMPHLEATGKVITEYYCRDCDHTVSENYVLIYTKLDKPGMGNASTYSEIGRWTIGETVDYKMIRDELYK